MRTGANSRFDFFGQNCLRGTGAAAERLAALALRPDTTWLVAAAAVVMPVSSDPDVDAAARTEQAAIGLSHDSRGDRQISLEGQAFHPKFTPDGKKLFYRVHTGNSSELWMTELDAVNL